MSTPAAAGIHRAKLWQIGGFALNNTATNLYLFFMNFIAYYLTGYVGVGVVLASTLITTMRIWDGVTDPFIGYLVDKTNGRFGKNRPFIVIGNNQPDYGYGYPSAAGGRKIYLFCDCLYGVYRWLYFSMCSH